jgi:hypothetical protein
MFSQLKDKNWKTDLAFLVDISGYLNNLNMNHLRKYVSQLIYIVGTGFKKTVFVLKTREAYLRISTLLRTASFSTGNKYHNIVSKLHKISVMINRFQERRKLNSTTSLPFLV